DSKTQTGSFTYGGRLPESSRWDTMLWDEGHWANLRQAEHVLRGTFPMRARGRSIELDLRMVGDGGVQSVQVLGYPVRRLRECLWFSVHLRCLDIPQLSLMRAMPTSTFCSTLSTARLTVRTWLL